MLGVSRLLLVLFAALLVGGGLLAIASGDPGGKWAGVILMICAVPLVIGAIYERMRYRSEASERSTTPAGPGGEPTRGTLEPRFRSTDEVFLDPTSGSRMRVYMDPATGERRYLEES
jgi:hypothetical protein